MVAGGFWDGKTVTVEPLGDPCIMFNDNGRVEKLARVLYALAIGVTQLKECGFISTYHLLSLLHNFKFRRLAQSSPLSLYSADL